MVKTLTNQNGKRQNGDMPKRQQTVNDVTARAHSRILYCGHSTQYSHPVKYILINSMTQVVETVLNFFNDFCKLHQTVSGSNKIFEYQ